MSEISTDLEHRVIDFVKQHPKGVKVTGIHANLRVSYTQLNPLLDKLVKYKAFSRDGKFYRPDNISAYQSGKYH